MSSWKIGIIGVAGAIGSFFHRFFREEGYEVFGSDIGTPLTNREVVESADVIFFCVPVLDAEGVIREMVPYASEKQLWVDTSSIKEGPLRAMEESKAEVVGLHGLGAPPKDTTTLEGQVMMVWKPRIHRWRHWVGHVLDKLDVTIVVKDPRTHDDVMLLNQDLIHDLSIIFAEVADSLDIRPHNLLELSTPLSQKMYGNIARILTNPNPGLYANIQMGNPRVLYMLDNLSESIAQIRDLVVHHNAEGYVEKLEKAKAYFGKDFLEKALKLYEKK